MRDSSNALEAIDALQASSVFVVCPTRPRGTRLLTVPQSNGSELCGWPACSKQLLAIPAPAGQICPAFLGTCHVHHAASDKMCLPRYRSTSAFFSTKNQASIAMIGNTTTTFGCSPRTAMVERHRRPSAFAKAGPPPHPQEPMTTVQLESAHDSVAAQHSPRRPAPPQPATMHTQSKGVFPQCARNHAHRQQVAAIPAYQSGTPTVASSVIRICAVRTDPGQLGTEKRAAHGPRACRSEVLALNHAKRPEASDGIPRGDHCLAG